MRLEAVILAAGKGTRMRSALPKVLHPLAGKPLLGHVVDQARALDAAAVHVIHGHGAAAVRQRFADPDIRWVLQEPQLGTGHALAEALPGVSTDARVLVLYGDVPLLRPDTLRPLVEAGGEQLAVLTALLDDPTGYGRILRQGGAVRRIVEHRDANPEERAITEINTGILCAPAALLKRLIPQLENRNAQGEYYLTDIIGLAAQAGLTIADCQATPDEILGVNSRQDLAHLEDLLRKRRAAEVLEQGVTLHDPARFDLRGELVAGEDVEIDVNVIIEGHVELGDRVRIGANCVIRDSRIGSDTNVRENCVIEEATVGDNCIVGPFARVRPGSEFAEHVHIGNFVETKKAQVARGSKINHLSYVGDAEIGQDVNVGAGTITCNYDGVAKHRTIIGDGAFVGSGTQLVAPVRVGRGATVGAGTTVTRDVPDDELVLSRTRQKVVPGWNRPEKKN